MKRARNGESTDVEPAGGALWAILDEMHEDSLFPLPVQIQRTASKCKSVLQSRAERTKTEKRNYAGLTSSNCYIGFLLEIMEL